MRVFIEHQHLHRCSSNFRMVVDKSFGQMLKCSSAKGDYGNSRTSFIQRSSPLVADLRTQFSRHVADPYLCGVSSLGACESASVSNAK